MKLTRIDLNSWLFQLAGKTLLVDPWLVDPLTFGASWLIELRHATPLAFTPETLPPLDFILLSQAQPDHCHRPTLARLDRQVPVIASPAAARIARDLGFQSVRALTSFEEHTSGHLQITAVPGAQVQGEQENGYLLRDQLNGTVLYYEPHQTTLSIQQQLAARTEIDVLLMPVVGLNFPILGEVVMGPDSALAMAKVLRPKTIVPTTLGEVHSEGWLGNLLKPVGTVSEFAAKLKASGLPSKFLQPAPGETLELAAVG